MTSRKRSRKPCAPLECNALGCHSARAPGSKWCEKHRIEKTREARKARKRAAHVETQEGDESLRQLIAFPEPAKYLALLRDTCRPRVNRRAIASRQGNPEPQDLEFETEDNPE